MPSPSENFSTARSNDWIFCYHTTLTKEQHTSAEFISPTQSPFNSKAYDPYFKYDSPATLHDKLRFSDSSVSTTSPFEDNSQGPDHSSSVTSTDQALLYDYRSIMFLLEESVQAQLLLKRFQKFL